jgi:hypothetical protein
LSKSKPPITSWRNGGIDNNTFGHSSGSYKAEEYKIVRRFDNCFGHSGESFKTKEDGNDKIRRELDRKNLRRIGQEK